MTKGLSVYYLDLAESATVTSCADTCLPVLAHVSEFPQLHGWKATNSGTWPFRSIRLSRQREDRPIDEGGRWKRLQQRHHSANTVSSNAWSSLVAGEVTTCMKLQEHLNPVSMVGGLNSYMTNQDGGDLFHETKRRISPENLGSLQNLDDLKLNYYRILP